MYHIKGKFKLGFRQFFIIACCGIILFSSKDILALDAPTGVNASNGVYSDKIRIDWNIVYRAYGYDVYRSVTNDLQTAQWHFYAASSPQEDENSIVPGQLYYYWVQAKENIGENIILSPFSSSDVGYADQGHPLQAPTDISGSKGTYSDKIVISWNTVSGAYGYDVYRSVTVDPQTAQWHFYAASSPQEDENSIVTGQIYYYWVQAKENIGGNIILSPYSYPGWGYADIQPFVEDQDSDILEFGIKYVNPNPFNPSTTITYNLPKTQYVILTIYSLTGQKIDTLVDKTMDAGMHNVVFDGIGLSSGLYFAILDIGYSIDTVKMLLVK